MKKIMLVVPALLIVGVLSAQSHDHDGMKERGSSRRNSGMHMMDMGCGMGGGMHGMMFDEASMKAEMKARGMSDADINKMLQMNKDRWEIMKKYKEASAREMMKARGMSDADIDKMLQIDKDRTAIMQEYNTMPVAP